MAKWRYRWISVGIIWVKYLVQRKQGYIGMWETISETDNWQDAEIQVQSLRQYGRTLDDDSE